MGFNGLSTIDSVVTSTAQTADRQSAKILAFPTVERDCTPAERTSIVPDQAPDRLKAIKIAGLPGVYAYPQANGTAPLRVRIRDPHRRNPASGAPIRYNIALDLDRSSSLKEIAAKVKEIETKVAQGWNPRGAQVTLRDFFYDEIVPRLNRQSRSPKTDFSRFRSLIEDQLGNLKIGDITTADIRQWRDNLLIGGGR